jgi:hypothetical protein
MPRLLIIAASVPPPRSRTVEIHPLLVARMISAKAGRAVLSARVLARPPCPELWMDWIERPARRSAA